MCTSIKYGYGKVKTFTKKGYLLLTAVPTSASQLAFWLAHAEKFSASTLFHYFMQFPKDVIEIRVIKSKTQNLHSSAPHKYTILVTDINKIM